MSDPNIAIFNIVNNENVANECSSLVTPLYIYIRNVVREGLSKVHVGQLDVHNNTIFKIFDLMQSLSTNM